MRYEEVPDGLSEGLIWTWETDSFAEIIAMKHLTIVVPEGENNLSSIVGTFKIFSRANAYQVEKGGKAQFKIELAGVSKKVDFYGGLFTVNPQVNISQVKKTDLIIIPSLNHNYHSTVKANRWSTT